MVMMAVNARRYDWATWLMGIMRSFLSGGFGAVAGISGPMITDGKDFNLSSGLAHTLESMAASFIIMAIVHMALFLQTHSGPDPVVDGDGKAA